MYPTTNFSNNPFLVVWEVTRACGLSCIHCRAKAQPNPHPKQLTTEEGLKLIDDVKLLGAPIIIFSGGDPLKRPDIFTLIEHAKTIGLIPNLSPSGTELLSQNIVKLAAAAGVHTVSLSLDGSTAENHDTFRGVKGVFAKTVKAARWVRQSGIRLQINTVISKNNIHQISEMADLVQKLGAQRWEVFYLVPTGRAQELTYPTANQYEQASYELYQESLVRPYQIAVIEGQFYRRLVMTQQNQGKGSTAFMPGMNSGNGFLFISHIGDIYPSGFLPLKAGNVRKDPLIGVYRNHPLFLKLRDSNQLKGVCRRCTFNTVCGGSRARAFALTGDYLESDPFCTYIPE